MAGSFHTVAPQKATVTEAKDLTPTYYIASADPDLPGITWIDSATATELPAANRNDLIRNVTTAPLTLSGAVINPGGSWRCTTDSTPANTAANWEEYFGAVTGDTVAPKTLALWAHTETATVAQQERIIQPLGVKSAIATYTSGGQYYEATINKAGLIQIAIVKNFTETFTIQTRKTNNFDAYTLAADGTFTQDTDGVTGTPNLVWSRENLDELWLITISGNNEPALPIRIYGNDIVTAPGVFNGEIEFAISVDGGPDLATTDGLQLVGTAFNTYTALSTGTGALIDFGQDLSVADFGLINFEFDTGDTYQSLEWINLKPAGNYPTLADKYGSAHVDIDYDLSDLSAGQVHFRSVSIRGIQRAWFFAIAKNGYVTPIATVSKTPVQVSVSGGATTINGGATSAPYLEGKGENTLTVDLPQNTSLNKSATEAAIAAIPGIATVTVSDPLNGVIDFTMNDGTGDVTFPVTTVATTNGIQTYTFTSNNNEERPAGGIDGWLFRLDNSLKQIRLRNISGKERVIFPNPIYRDAVAQGDPLNGSNLLTSPLAFADNQLRQISYSNIDSDSGGGLSDGDVEFSVMDVWEFTSRYQIKKIHTLVVSSGVGSGWDNNEWNVEIHPVKNALPVAYTPGTARQLTVTLPSGGTSTHTIFDNIDWFLSFTPSGGKQFINTPTAQSGLAIASINNKGGAVFRPDGTGNCTVTLAEEDIPGQVSVTNLNVTPGAWLNLPGGLEFTTSTISSATVNRPFYRFTDSLVRRININGYYRANGGAVTQIRNAEFNHIGDSAAQEIATSTGFNFHGVHECWLCIEDEYSGAVWEINYDVQADDVTSIMNYNYYPGRSFGFFN